MRLSIFSVISVLLLFANGGFGSSVENPAELRPNEKITLAVKAKDVNFYTFRGEAGRCLNLVVEQQDADVKVTLFDSQNNKLAEVDRSNTIRGPERLTFVLPHTDVYTVKVLSVAVGSEKSGYSIELKPFTAPTENDYKRIRAEKLMSDGANDSESKNPQIYNQAIADFNESIKIWREIGDNYEEIVSLYGLGWAYHYQNEFESAALNFDTAAEIAEKTGEIFMRGHALRGSGNAYLQLGEYELAEYKFEKSVNVFRQLNISRYVGFALYGGGVVKRILRRDDEAFQMLNQALEIRRQVNDVRGTVLTLIELARAAFNRNEFDLGLQFLNEAREIQLNAKIGGEVEIFSAMSWGFLRTKEYQKADELVEKVLTIRRREANLAGEAEALNVRGLIYEATENWVQGAENYEAAIKIIETLRDKTQNERLRLAFIEQTQFYYANYIGFLMLRHRIEPAKGFDRKALEVVERSKSRGLLESITDENSATGTKPQLPELSEETRIRAVYIGLLKDLRQASGETRRKQIITELIDTRRRKYAVENKIRQATNKPNVRAGENSIKFDELQTLLDDETVLLNFKLSGLEDTVGNTFPSYAWAISKRENTSFEMPPRPEIEKKVRRLYELLTLRNRLSPATAKINVADVEREIEKLTAELSDILLKPLTENGKILVGKKRLLIVANGILQSLPFSILPFPTTQTVEKKQILLEKFEIVNLPSASVWRTLREREQKRRTPEKTVAVIADPVFSATDERFSMLKISAKEATAAKSRQVLRLGDFFGNGMLPRLFNTRLEANAISSYIAPEKKLIRLDFNADREDLLKTNLADFRILHFATHALIDDDQPELSGLALSLVNRAKKPLDGILLAGDIEKFKLNTDLVVLSGCRTALGKQLRGEGYVGLTQNFMKAGATRVVSSLWAVEDRATAQLMANFYKHLLGKNPQKPAAALRLAQLEMAQNPRWKNPYYWGAFVIQGDY